MGRQTAKMSVTGCAVTAWPPGSPSCRRRPCNCPQMRLVQLGTGHTGPPKADKGQTSTFPPFLCGASWPFLCSSGPHGLWGQCQDRIRNAESSAGSPSTSPTKMPGTPGLCSHWPRQVAPLHLVILMLPAEPRLPHPSAHSEGPCAPWGPLPNGPRKTRSLGTSQPVGTQLGRGGQAPAP